MKALSQGMAWTLRGSFPHRFRWSMFLECRYFYLAYFSRILPVEKTEKKRDQFRNRWNADSRHESAILGWLCKEVYSWILTRSRLGPVVLADRCCRVSEEVPLFPKCFHGRNQQTNKLTNPTNNGWVAKMAAGCNRFSRLVLVLSSWCQVRLE